MLAKKANIFFREPYVSLTLGSKQGNPGLAYKSVCITTAKHPEFARF